MSKSISNHFVGTGGHRAFFGNETSSFIESSKDAESIIQERVKGLDLREHPIKNKKYLSAKQIRAVKKKIQNRTATIEEYRNMRMSERLNARRTAGRDAFWRAEKKRLLSGQLPTRKWTATQIEDILSGKKPVFNGKTIQAHHTFSVNKYPHLANKAEVMYPTTFQEHFFEWHGGNWKTSLPAKRLKKHKKGV